MIEDSELELMCRSSVCGGVSTDERQTMFVPIRLSLHGHADQGDTITSRLIRRDHCSFAEFEY